MRPCCSTPSVVPHTSCGTIKTWKSGQALKHRTDLLERLYRRAAPLSLSFGGYADWVRFKNSWANVAGERYGKQTGLVFVKGINECLEQLCCYYAGPTDYNKGKGSHRNADDHLCGVDREGDMLAFETYVEKCIDLLPKSTLSVCI